MKKQVFVASTGDMGILVREKRKLSGLTQAEAAALCKVGIRFISDLENGKDTLQIGKMLHVLKAFGLQMAIEGRGLPHE